MPLKCVRVWPSNTALRPEPAHMGQCLLESITNSQKKKTVYSTKGLIL